MLPSAAETLFFCVLPGSEPHLEVFVAELADGLPAAVFVAGDDGGQGYAVEDVVLDLV